jgi:hypothetical protein
MTLEDVQNPAQDTVGDTKPADTSTKEEQFEKLKGVNLLDVLDQAQIERIVEQVKQDRSRGKKYYETELEPKYIARQQAFRSSKSDLKKRFPDLVFILDLSDSSVHDTVESIMPSLMEIFHSAEKILNLQGATEEDDGPAETMEDVIDWQLNRKNQFWLQSFDWLKAMLIENYSVLKVWWKRDETYKRYEVVFNDEELESLKNDPAVTVEMVKQTNPPDPETGLAIYHVRYLLRKRTANHPVVETVPNTELYYDPDAKTLEDANYVIHHKPVTISFLRIQEKQGKFKNVTLAREGAGDIKKSQYEIMLDKASVKDESYSDNDPGRKEVVLYECYEKLSLSDEDEELVDLIVTLANDTPVRIEVNTMGGHPFIDLSAVRDPHKMQAHRGIADLVREIQDLRTILLLQMAYNVIKNNDRQLFIDYNKVRDSAEIRGNHKVVQINGDPNTVCKWSPEEPFSPEVLKLMEYARNILENRVGVTAYNQGTDRDSLNKTATGIQAIMQAANKRIALIARIAAETGYNKLFRRLIYLNQTFLDEQTVLRVTNKQRIVRPDDISGEIDIIVNSGIGTGTKAAEIQSLQMLLGMYEKLVDAGIAKRSHVAYAAGKLIENVGFKNVHDFIKRVEDIEAEDQQAAIAQQRAAGIVAAAGAGAMGEPGAAGGIDPRIAELLAAAGAAASPRQAPQGGIER